MQAQVQGLDGAGRSPTPHAHEVHDEQGAGCPAGAQINAVRQDGRADCANPVAAVGERHGQARVQQHVTNQAAAHTAGNGEQQEAHNVEPEGARHGTAEQAVGDNGGNVDDAEYLVGVKELMHGRSPAYVMRVLWVSVGEVRATGGGRVTTSSPHPALFACART